MVTEPSSTPPPVHLSIVGVHRDVTVTWPAGWPPPREGETIRPPASGALIVHRVVWYPEGEDDKESFVYVVLR